MMKKISITLFVLIIWAVQGFSIDKAGSTAEFLLIPPDARAMGTGESFTPVADDVYSCYWNPAGLSQLSGLNMGYSHNFWFMDFNFDSFVFSYSLEKKGTIGGYINTLWMSDLIQKVDDFGDFIDDEFVEARFINICLAYAFSPFKIKWISPINQMQIGTSLKLISQKIYEHDASGFALDVGIINNNFFTKDLSLGIVLNNLGFNSKFLDSGESEKLPLKLNLGVSHKKQVFKKQEQIIFVLPALKYGFANNYGSTVSAGIETIYYNKPNNLSLILRTGYLLPFDKYLNTGIKTGFGIVYSNITFDYAASFYAEVNYTHSVTLKYKY